MRRALLTLVALVGLGAGPAVAAVTHEDFVVKTAEDLFDVCSTDPSESLHTAAANFCQGYVVGAYHTYQALMAKPGHRPIICPPSPMPSRTQAIAEFVAWGKARPEYQNEVPVEVLFKFLTERWPCPTK